MIRPPYYPWCAFDDRRFLTSRRVPLYQNRENPGRLTVHSTSSELRDRLLCEYQRVSYEICGVLKGEYAASGDGLMLFDRQGSCISINFPNDAAIIARMVFDQANDLDLRRNRQELYAVWEDVPLIERSAIFSHVYYANYYHYSFELIQKIRLLDGFGVDTVLLPDEMTGASFQRDLMDRAIGARGLRSLAHAVRVRDPVVVQTYQSAEALAWLRGLYELNAPPNGRKYYVRRAPQPGRLANNIAETPEFCRLLERHDFTVVDFGGGENAIQDQIHMLDGASLVLATHGAGLTNLAYLQGPLRVIEVFGPAVLSTSFMRISTDLGFDHHALISEDLDANQDILIDCSLLESLLTP